MCHRCQRLAGGEQTSVECVEDSADVARVSSTGQDHLPESDSRLLSTRVAISESARDHGVVIDRELSLASHATAVCRALTPTPTCSPHTVRTSHQDTCSATHCCTASSAGSNYSLYRMLQRVVTAPIGVTMLHYYCGNCTGFQSVSELFSRSRGWFISHWLELHTYS